jgi:spore coat protein U-like protein
MKKILLPLAAALAIAAAGSASATSTPPSGFNVTVNLTSACSVTSAPTPVAFNYTSGQTGAASPTAGSGAFQVTCTNNLPYTMALDATSGTFTTVGLNYTLSLSSSSSTGTGAAQSFTVGGSIAANQSGTCAVASCADTSARTLTISY